jgi:hypothetical protein
VTDRIIVYNNPQGFIDPLGLCAIDQTIDFFWSQFDLITDFWSGTGSLFSFLVSGISLGSSYATVTKVSTPSGAALWGVSIIATKLSIMNSLTNNTRMGNHIDLGLSAVGVTSAYALGGYLSPVVASGSFGWAIGTWVNNVGVYGTNQTIGDWWTDRAIDWFN